MGLADRTPPTVEEYREYPTRFSNWGRWGADDHLGTLNHITEQTRLAAMALAREGKSVSLSRPLAVHPSARNPIPVQHYMNISEGSSGDYIGIYYHGRTNTHIDAFCHMFIGEEGKMYNDRRSTDVVSSGARSNSVDHWRNGIITRGVLYDIARLRGVDYVAPGEPVHGWELEEAAKAQGIEPRPGDAVFVRCGWAPFFEAHPNVILQGAPADYYLDGQPFVAPGVHASCIEFLYEHDAALMSWDFLDAGGQGYPPLRPPMSNQPRSIPIHEICIPFMGMPLLDNANLEDVARECAARSRWEFLLFVAPLVVVGGTGSPVNPIAVF